MCPLTPLSICDTQQLHNCTSTLIHAFGAIHTDTCSQQCSHSKSGPWQGQSPAWGPPGVGDGERGVRRGRHLGERGRGLPPGPVLTSRLGVRALESPTLGLNTGASYITASCLSSFLSKCNRTYLKGEIGRIKRVNLLKHLDKLGSV